MSKIIKVSVKWMRAPFKPCEPNYIKRVCKGRCCESSKGAAIVSILPDEVGRINDYGAGVKGGLINTEGRCPFKTDDHLCSIHGDRQEPWGCKASPFVINDNDTLVIRHRYIHFPCYNASGSKPAYISHRRALEVVVGAANAASIAARMLCNTQSDFKITIHSNNYKRMTYKQQTSKGGARHG